MKRKNEKKKNKKINFSLPLKFFSSLPNISLALFGIKINTTKKKLDNKIKIESKYLMPR